MTHPLLSSLTAIDAVLDEVARVNPVFLSTEEKKAVMVLGAKVRARIDAVQMAVIAASDDVADQSGARTAAAWLAHETRDHPGLVRQSARLAKALDRHWHRVARELAAGQITTAQAHVITRALEALPDDIDSALTAKAEIHLLEKAADFGPRELARLGERILDVLAPRSPKRPTTGACWPRRTVSAKPPGSPSAAVETAPPRRTSVCPTTSPTD